MDLGLGRVNGSMWWKIAMEVMMRGQAATLSDLLTVEANIRVNGEDVTR